MKPKPDAQQPAAPKEEAPAEHEPEQLARLQEEVKQAKDQYVRTMAEFENTKKRLHRDKEEFAKYAAESLIRELLPIVDSLDHALVAVDPSTPPARLASPNEAAGVARDSAPAGLRKQPDTDAVIEGVRLIRQQLLGLLAKEGVQRIPTVGEPFDPHKHEAVGQVEATDGQADSTVAEEVHVGYTMHGKVIRPAMVKIAKKIAESDKQDNQQDETTNEVGG